MSDSTIYPADTVDSVGENMSDSTIYPADTVDVYGNVWPTVGENIRNGLFGKLKAGKININGKNITSRDFKISDIQNQNFTINKKGVLIFIDKVYSGLFFLRFSYSSNFCMIVSTSSFENIQADISILYTE